MARLTLETPLAQKQELPPLAAAFRHTALPPLDEQLPVVLPCFRLMLELD